MTQNKLSLRAVKFVDEYLVDLCAKDAAIRAGYSRKAASCAGTRLLADERVQQLLQRRMQVRAARVEVKQDDVLLELKRIALADVTKLFDQHGRPRPLAEMCDDLRHMIAGVEVETTEFSGAVRQLDDGPSQQHKFVVRTSKLKCWDKVRALELLMRHLGMLNDKLQLTGTVTVVHRNELLQKVGAALAAAQREVPALPAPVAQA